MLSNAFIYSLLQLVTPTGCGFLFILFFVFEKITRDKKDVVLKLSVFLTVSLLVFAVFAYLLSKMCIANATQFVFILELLFAFFLILFALWYMGAKFLKNLSTGFGWAAVFVYAFLFSSSSIANLGPMLGELLIYNLGADVETPVFGFAMLFGLGASLAFSLILFALSFIYPILRGKNSWLMVQTFIGFLILLAAIAMLIRTIDAVAGV